MKLEDVTAEWVDSVCGKTSSDRRKFGSFHTFDYVQVEHITQKDWLQKMTILSGGDTGKYKHTPIEILIFDCDYGNFIASDAGSFRNCRERDVTKAFNQIIFPEQGIDDIIMEIAFYSSLTREEVVNKYASNLMTLLKVLREEREKFLGGVLC